LSSNNKFICRRGIAASNLSDFIGFLRNDYDSAPGVCGVSHTDQLLFQFNECRQVDARRSDRHPDAGHGVEHPTGNRNYDLRRPLYRQKLARRSMRHSQYRELTAKIRVPSVVDFQLLPNMGRMNG
jgi:hypothetical protein